MLKNRYHYLPLFSFLVPVIGLGCGSDPPAGPRPDRLTLQLSASTMKAGDTITASVLVFDNQGGTTDMIVAPSVAGGPSGNGAITVSGTGTDADPFKITGTRAGEYKISAKLENRTVTAPLVVTAAAPTTGPDFHVRLARDAAGADVTNVAAGAALVYRYSVTDPFGNPVLTPNVTATTTMPGAILGPVDTQDVDAAGSPFYQGTILNFARSGTWDVGAHVVGTNLTQKKTLVVGTDAAALVAHLTLSSNIAAVGNPLSYKVVVLDQFGNEDTSALGRLSLQFSAPPSVVPTCAPNACATPAPSGTIRFAEAGSVQVTASFSGTPAIVSDSLYVSSINVPVPPTLTILDPKPTDVFAPGATIDVRVQTHTASPAGGSVYFIATGQFGRSGSAIVGQDVCPIVASCPPTLSFTVPGGFPYGTESLLVVVTDATSGAAISKSVTFTVDPVAAIVASGGRAVSVVGRGGNLNAPMGLATSSIGGTNEIFVANNQKGSILRLNLAGGLPVIPNAGNVFASGLPSAPSDVRLRPNPAALGTYPPAAFQGLFVATDGVGRLRLTDAAGFITTPALAPSNIASTAYDAAGARLFGSDFGGNQVRVINPTTFADVANTPLSFGGSVNAPWGVAFFSSGLPLTTKVIAGADGNDQLWMCDLGTTASLDANCTASRTRIASRNVGASVRNPRAILVSAATGLVYVASSGNGRVLAYNLASCAGGTCAEQVVVSGLDTPNGLALDAAGNLYVSDEALNLVIRVAPGGIPF